ncbi:hypothetical protein NMY22_g15398 [Coprinellus aureogranulatus]|nr:hypothetical protein NMY22_g15398 [Coprinellus aureogranulatus]
MPLCAPGASPVPWVPSEKLSQVGLSDSYWGGALEIRLLDISIHLSGSWPDREPFLHKSSTFNGREEVTMEVWNTANSLLLAILRFEGVLKDLNTESVSSDSPTTSVVTLHRNPHFPQPTHRSSSCLPTTLSLNLFLVRLLPTQRVSFRVLTRTLSTVPADRAGTADIIGFGQDGVWILRNSIRPDIRRVIQDYGENAGGWRVSKNVRLVGDTTGNNRADIIGFGYSGVLISRNNGDNTFGPQTLAVNDFGTASGWVNEKHVRYAANLRKNQGQVDIIGFGDGGILVSLNNGNGTFGPTKLVLNDFGYNAGGWRIEKHLRYLGDATGDGLPDVVAFGETSVILATNKGDGTFNAGTAVINNFTYGSGGWRIEKHPRTIADLTGDKRVDVVGFGDAGVWVAINNGNGTFQNPRLAVNDFGYNQGWRVEKHPRFVADVNNNKLGDIIGFGGAGVYLALNQGGGNFGPAKLVLKDFGTDQGWQVDKHPRYVVDLTGDGSADIIGFGENSVWVSYNDGKGNFSPVQKLTDDFSYSGGKWAVDKTVRWVTTLA